MRKLVSLSFSRILIQNGNESFRKELLKQSLAYFEDMLASYLSFKKECIDGTGLQKLIPRFLFRKFDRSIAQQIKDEGLGGLQDYELSNLLVYVNKYFGIMVLIDLIKHLLNFTGSDFEVDEDKVLCRA